jgi:hypothetical protein
MTGELKRQETWWEGHENLSFLLVDVGDEILGSGDEPTVLKFKENIGGRVIDGSNATNGSVGGCFNQFKANEERMGDGGFVISEGEGEIDVAVGQLSGTLLCINAFELHKHDGIAAETIFLHEEGNENAVNIEHKVFSFNTVEHVVIAHERYFAMHAVGLAQAANLIDFLSFYHPLLIFAPKALRRSSMFS